MMSTSSARNVPLWRAIVVHSLLVLSMIFGFAAACAYGQDQSAVSNPAKKIQTGTALDTPLLFPGLVKEKPKSGRFVKTAKGYMVPFTVTIPKTKIRIEMVPIPGGKFKMGSPAGEEGRNADEGPQIEITIEPFWMAKHETTWAQFKRFMELHDIFREFEIKKLRKITDKNRVAAISAPSTLYDPEFTYEAGDHPNQPAATMTQFTAKQFTKWLSLSNKMFFRLPTESEWEYACRAGTTTRYSFGDDASKLNEYAWNDDNADYERHEVGQLKPNPWGLYDMHGNVAEWVLDQHYEGGFNHLKGKKGLTSLTAFQTPTTLFPRVAKGGSFESTPEECRSAARLASSEDWKMEDPNEPKSPYWFTTEPATGVGLRVMIPLNPPSTAKGRLRFWDADISEITELVKKRAEVDGKGRVGLYDDKLRQEAKKLNK